MPLQSSGSISADDLNQELGNPPGTSIDLETAANALLENASRPHSMDEFYGASSGYNYTFNDWDGIVSVSEFGLIISTVGNAASRTINTSNFSPVTSLTPRTISITIVAPDTFNGEEVDNAGQSITDTRQVDQPAVGRYLELTAVDPSLTGEETQVVLNINDLYYNDTAWTLSDVPTSGFNGLDLAIYNGNGTGDTTRTLFLNENTSGTERRTTFTVTSNVDSKTSSTEVFQTSYIPIIKPEFEPSLTSIGWTYSESGSGAANVLAITLTGGSPADVVTFYIAGNHFGLVQIDPNVPVTATGGPWVAEATNDGAGYFQIGIYPLTTNYGSGNNTEDLSISMTNSGGTTSKSVSLYQTYYVAPVYSWGGTVSISRNDGIVSVTGDDSAGSITLTPSSFSLVGSPTTRTVTVGNIVIPSGYQNAGTSFSQDVNVTQQAADEIINISTATSVVDPQGDGIIIYVDTLDEVYSTSWTAYITSTDQSNSTGWVSLAAGSTGTGDSSFYVNVDPNYSGSNGYDGTTRYFDIRVDKDGGGLSSNTLSFSQAVGTAPAQSPIFSTSPTSLTWSYSQSGSGAYQTITATRTGGSTPQQVSFYITGENFGLVQTDGNVPITVSGGPWIAEAINDGAGSFQVGVYPLTTNSSTSIENTEDLNIYMAATGAPATSINVPLTQTVATTTTTTTQPPQQSWIAERNDNGAVGRIWLAQGYSSGDEVLVSDGSGICWTLGSLSTLSGQYSITGACPSVSCIEYEIQNEGFTSVTFSYVDCTTGNLELITVSSNDFDSVCAEEGTLFYDSGDTNYFVYMLGSC